MSTWVNPKTGKTLGRAGTPAPIARRSQATRLLEGEFRAAKATFHVQIPWFNSLFNRGLLRAGQRANSTSRMMIGIEIPAAKAGSAYHTGSSERMRLCQPSDGGYRSRDCRHRNKITYCNIETFVVEPACLRPNGRKSGHPWTIR